MTKLVFEKSKKKIKMENVIKINIFLNHHFFCVCWVAWALFFAVQYIESLHFLLKITCIFSKCIYYFYY